MLTTSVTLRQFETIDGLLSVCLRRPAIESLLPLGRDATVARFFRPEWELFDACVDAIGYPVANDYASALECAAAIVTGGLLGTVKVLDEAA